VSGCAGNMRVMCAQLFLVFPLYLSGFLGIPTLPSAGRKNDDFQRFNRY